MEKPTALFGNGGVPLFAMAMGAGDNKKASRILGNSFALLAVSSVALTALGFASCKPILFAFGAGDESFVYARDYLNIYLEQSGDGSMIDINVKK